METALFVALMYAGLCGWGAAAIMQKKGRSATAGAVLGVLLGLIGILIAACLSDQKRDELRIAEINATAAMAEAA
ncbi:hypothetical protein, partial [Ancylobacter lacus]|uniref:hypothetical protein n=1 Tax=Ancylobacter lacus TaxID=2579970 RepID=UPI001BCD69DF